MRTMVYDKLDKPKLTSMDYTCPVLHHRTLQHRTTLLVISSIVAMFLVMLASLVLGSNALTVATVMHRLIDPATDHGAIVWGSRVPRTVLGGVVGACLGIAGAVMQGQTRNPLADPGLFGVSAGASFAVVLGVYALKSSSTTVILGLALVGAVGASLIVFGVAALGRSLASPVPLAIAGTAITALFTALTSFVVLSDENTLAAYRIWVVGSLSGRQLNGLGGVGVFIAAGLLLAAVNVRSLDSLALGSDVAQSLGENLIMARFVGLGAITLLTSAAVALSGPIGFIGLTAPHIARWVVGGSYRKLIPLSGIIGVIVLLGSDVVGRRVGGLAEISVGVILSIIGGIIFVIIVRRTRIATL